MKNLLEKNKIISWKTFSFLFVITFAFIFSICLIKFNFSDNKIENKIFIIFRYDDYTDGSSRYVEYNILKIAGKYGFPLNFATIPYPRGNEISDSAVNFIKPYVDNNSVEITLHGYTHNPDFYLRYIENISSFSEFWDQNKYEQHKMILHGKSILESKFDIIINTFVPPHNTYDETTLDVLQDLDFDIISASWVWAIENETINYPKLRYFHCYGNDFNNLIETIEAYRNKTLTKPLIFPIFFHDFNFEESGKDSDKVTTNFKRFDEIC